MVTLVLALATIILVGPSSGGLSQDAQNPWVGSSQISPSYSTSSYDSLSYNSSSITSLENESMTYAPATMSVGRGYYASHPIGYFSLSSQRTSVQNTRSGTFMQFEAQNSHGLDGGREVLAYENSYIWDGREYGGGSSVQMKINEDITDGKIHIGARQAGLDDHKSWKDRLLEVDEDYVGTYHIQKNMSIGIPYHTTRGTYDWLSVVDDPPRVYDSWYRSNPEKIFDSQMAN